MYFSLYHLTFLGITHFGPQSDLVKGIKEVVLTYFYLGVLVE